MVKKVKSLPYIKEHDVFFIVIFKNDRGGILYYFLRCRNLSLIVQLTDQSIEEKDRLDSSFEFDGIRRMPIAVIDAEFGSTRSTFC